VNTLKPLLIFAVLVGVCYGVYSRINHKSDAPPAETIGAWEGAPNVQIGDGSGGGLGKVASEGGFAPPRMAIPGDPGSHGSLDPSQSHGQEFAPSGPGASPVGSPGWAEAAPPGGPGDYATGGNDPQYNAGIGGADARYGAPADPYAQPVDPQYDRYNDPLAGASGASQSAFAGAFEQAKRELDSGRLAEAHYQLSRWYEEPGLSPAEQQQLTEVLDQLAGTLIYSTQNLLDPACEVQPGESLERIAQRYNVPWQLLAKINGIEDPHSLRPGERLKVVRGPFSAVISLNKRTLTLMLKHGYAGRFPIGIGREHPPKEGEFYVTDKVIDPTYYGPGRTIERGDRDNPLGRRWLGLGNQMGIHGTNDPRSIGRTDLPGSISLNERDVDDVFDILSEGSKVVIRQ
jgi:hypothetical protein